MGPGLESEIRLGVEAHAEDDDGEEGGEVAGKLPVLPLPRLTGRRRRPIEEVPVGPLLGSGGREPLQFAAALRPQGRADPCPQHAR